MAKSAVDLDVNIVLSKYGFIGVAAFANIKLGIQKLCAEVMCKNAILSKGAAGQTQYFERILHFQREICGKH